MILNKEVCGITVVSRANGKINYKRGNDPTIFSMTDAGYSVHMHRHTINIPRLIVPCTKEDKELILGTRNHRALSEWLICLLLGWIPDQENLSRVYTVMRTTTWTRFPSGVWHRIVTHIPRYITHPSGTGLLELTPPQGHVYNPRHLPPHHSQQTLALNAKPDPIQARVAEMQAKADKARQLQAQTLSAIEAQALKLNQLLVVMAAEVGSKASRNVVARAFGESVEKEEHPACDDFFKAARALHDLAQ